MNFIESAQDLFPLFGLGPQVDQMILVLEEQELYAQAKTSKESDLKYNSNKNGPMKERINVFKESLTNSFLGSFNNSLVKQLGSLKDDNSQNGTIRIPDELLRQEDQHSFRETSSFNSEPKRENSRNGTRENSGKDVLNGSDKNRIRLVKASFNFKKEKAKDLALKKGDVVEVLHMTQDGWWVGKNLSSGEQGFFPLNFVEMID